MQNRIGPDNAGPFGVLQALADGIKLFFKEQSIPDTADRRMFQLAPYLSVLPGVPRVLDRPDRRRGLDRRAPDLPAARRPARSACCSCSMMSGIGLYGVMLAGWSSGSKYPLLGSVRASAQLLSLRGRVRPRDRRGPAHSRHALDPRHRRTRQAWTSWHSFVTAVVLGADDRRVRHLPDRRGRRDQPPAVRPRRGRAGARRRLPHRVLRHPVRDLLPRRVHEPHHHVGDRGDAVPRRPVRARARLPARRTARSTCGSCRSSGSSRS